MLNILGEGSMDETKALVSKALSVPGAGVHWYGKAEAKKGKSVHTTVATPPLHTGCKPHTISSPRTCPGDTLEDAYTRALPAGRKMAHITFTADSFRELKQRVAPFGLLTDLTTAPPVLPPPYPSLPMTRFG